MCLASDLEYLSSAILASKDSESLSAEESEPLPQDLGELSSCAQKKREVQNQHQVTFAREKKSR
jgi:hypothetical protein